jgi:hypothetical protein
MLRYEATVNDGKDASFLSMTEVKKNCSEWRDYSSRKVQEQSFPKSFEPYKIFKVI